MRIVTIETASLGDRSYLAHDGQVGMVIDPQRDLDRVLDLVAREGVRVSHVLETHVHNDYVSGGLELARSTGATYVLPAHSSVEFDHLSVHDGDTLEPGRMRVRVLHTPGHTRHHVSYVLHDEDDAAAAVFTGGSMLFGSTGRTDLVGPDMTLPLAYAQYHSVRRQAAELPSATAVLPTHGFGSFCAATPTCGDTSTIGEQISVNPALTMTERDYVDTLLAGLGAYPAYYARMGPINRRGPAPIDLSAPTPVEPSELRARIEAGQWVVDLRERTAFAAGHLAGSLGFELSQSFATYLGWLYRPGTPLTLIGRTPAQVLQARRELARIGVDELAGAATGDIATLAAGQPLRSYPVTDFAALATALRRGRVRMLDARSKVERCRGHVAGSQHIPLHELAGRIDEVPHGQVWVYCASGYRAAIAASILDHFGRDVVLIDDSYDSAMAAVLEQQDIGSDQQHEVSR